MEESGFCINCGSADASMFLVNEQILLCIQQWAAPILIQASDIICKICWTVAQQTLRSTAENNTGLESRLTGRNCAVCDKILGPRTRSHRVDALRTDSEHHSNIKNIIMERISVEIRASHFICHPCWQKADRAAKNYTLPSSSTKSNQLRCVNCGINLSRLKRHILHDSAILLRVQQRVAPQVVTASDYICDACHNLHIVKQEEPQEQDSAMVGHQGICLTCGVSLANRPRRHSLNDEGNHHIVDIVQSWIQPREIQPSDLICHRCYQRADRAAVNAILTPIDNPIPPQDETITLPNYARASDTHRRCIFIKCNSTSYKMVPFVLRVKLFRDHNFYVPPECRICEQHMARQSWSELLDSENVIRQFRAHHIEDFVDLLKTMMCDR